MALQLILVSHLSLDYCSISGWEVFTVGPYCTSLFSRKKIITFSEIALVSVQLIAWLVALWSREYIGLKILALLQWIFVSLSKVAIKQRNKIYNLFKLFFISHLAALRPTLGHKQGGSLTHLMLITTLFQVQPVCQKEPRNKVGSQSLTESISGIRATNLPILSITCYPTVSLSPKMY